MKFRLVAAAIVSCCMFAAAANAQGIFAPGDTILGGQSDGTSFSVGVAGFTGGANNWPDGESPDHAIDGVGQKYLNFGKTNTGILVTPASGSSIAQSIKFWAANDAIERDPSGFELYGTNGDVSGAGPFAISDFTLVASGAISLPDSRNDGGAAALDDANSASSSFSNSNAYASYLVLFPDVKNNGAANSMQIAEVQLYSVPEPATGGVLAILLAGLAAFRRRNG
ncbi:MAG: PEP-CTERM sorting domain-containing protein [Pirellulaceae bacterium]|nr:PEP-CTERM sorting domain-containing protein [Planctomycetales bacterium]